MNTDAASAFICQNRLPYLCGSPSGHAEGNSRGVDSCWRLQSAAMPDGFLIDFLGCSQFFITFFPSSVCHRTLYFAPIYTHSGGGGRERKRNQEYILDNRAEWMKQSVTSSIPLTFTGSFTVSLKWLLLETNGKRPSCWKRFSILIQSVCLQESKWKRFQNTNAGNWAGLEAVRSRENEINKMKKHVCCCYKKLITSVRFGQRRASPKMQRQIFATMHLRLRVLLHCAGHWKKELR